MIVSGPDKKLVIVAGMHRSGTSAYMGSIERLGVRLGKKLAPGHAGINDKGYKEDTEVLDLHEDLLWSLSSAWDDIFPLDLALFSASEKQAAKNKIRRILSEYFRTSDCCGVKDPRICLFLPLWLEVCQEEHIETCFIIPFRNPFTVAKSLETRDGYLKDMSLVLWTKYMLSVEKYSRGYDRIMLSYENLIADPTKSIATLLDHLNLPTQSDRTDQIREGASFIATKLNRSGTTPLPEKDSGTFPATISSDVFDILKDFDGGNIDQHAEKKIDKIDELYNEFFMQLDPIIVHQVQIFRKHATRYRRYWRDAMGSQSVKLGQAIKKILFLNQ